MSAQRLRAAAAAMRARAEAATHGDGQPLPWIAESQGGGSLHEVYAEHYGTQVAVNVHQTDAAHIASWHPAVALAVADLLEDMARLEDEGDSGGPVVRRAALAVADAYLGEA